MLVLRRLHLYTMSKLSTLQAAWTELYKTRLPQLAKARDGAQDKWPVYLDHCFARIILDNAVGRDQPWAGVVKAPATKNMTEQQLQDAIHLGNEIAEGKADLVELDERSLELRGKKSKASVPAAKKRKHHSPQEKDDAASGAAKPVKASKKAVDSPDIRKHFKQQPKNQAKTGDIITLNDNSAELDEARTMIANSPDLTAFRKEVLTLLTYVPKGHYTTYGAMSDHISSTTHKTCARAIGNAMRNNPYAPQVPCHRVLAGDGRIGGFGGDWGEQGKHADKKVKLLAEEGVKFDSNGKVKGPVFRAFGTLMK